MHISPLKVPRNGVYHADIEDNNYRYYFVHVAALQRFGTFGQATTGLLAWCVAPAESVLK